MEVSAFSSLYRSDAWPDPAQPAFINAVAAVRRAPPPLALLARLKAMEAAFGRRPGARNAPRTLDLDLIDYNGEIIDATGSLTLPHPRAACRAFVLAPIAEIAPGWRHPVLGESAAALLACAPACGLAVEAPPPALARP